jgi:tartrate dehydrogenase/decarboxylase / D-malate dehydrogenase
VRPGKRLLCLPNVYVLEHFKGPVYAALTPSWGGDLAKYKVAVIEGDGIGHEVVPEGMRVLEAAGRLCDVEFSWANFDWGCEVYRKTGRMMPEDGLQQLRPFDAIYLGAVGYPDVPDHISLWGLLIPIRRAFQQYINLRPVRLLEGIDSPLKRAAAGSIDLSIVRENNEGEYSEVGGRMYRGTADEMAMQESIFTRRGCERAMRYAFELAGKRRGHVTSATKSNGIVHTMPFWDECFAGVSREFPEIRTDQYHIDILAAHFVAHPDWFDVVVASNLFGDILSDLGAAVVGSIGLLPAANLNPERTFPSMFEPVHGSAPDIVGKGIANPIAQIRSGGMMLEHFGEHRAAEAIERACQSVIARREVRTPDLGGKATTKDVGEAIASEVAVLARK